MLNNHLFRVFAILRSTIIHYTNVLGENQFAFNSQTRVAAESLDWIIFIVVMAMLKHYF